jgi:hypothetical protein
MCADVMMVLHSARARCVCMIYYLNAYGLSISVQHMHCTPTDRGGCTKRNRPQIKAYQGVLAAVPKRGAL